MECYHHSMPIKDYRPQERSCPICGTTFFVGGRGRPPLSRKTCSKACGASLQIRQPEVRQLAPVDAAYVAGYLDGEGSIILWDRGPGHRRLMLRVLITNTHRASLDWVQATVGSGKVFPRPPRKEPRYLPCFVWQIYGHNAVAFLEQVEPYMRIKRDKAVLAIESQRRPT